MTSKVSKQSPTFAQDIDSNEIFHNSPETQKPNEAKESILSDSQLTFDVMTIQSKHQFDLTETPRKNITIQESVSSNESRAGLFMNQEIQDPLDFTEGATKAGDVLRLLHVSSQKLLEKKTMPNFKTQSFQTDEQNCDSNGFSTETETEKYDESFRPVFNPQELKLDELRSHEKYSVPCVERKHFQMTEDILNPTKYIRESCNEDYTILKINSQDSKEIDLRTHVTGNKCNEVFNSEFNSSADLSNSIYIRNQLESNLGCRRGFKKIMTPPLPKSRTSDIKEFASIFFVIILGISAYGVFYFLQGFKPKSNTSAALGSLSGGILLLFIFSCLHHIIKKQ